MLRRSLTLYAVCLALAGLILFAPARAFAQTTSSDVVMVLPFENTSSRPEYNWAGESFADGLSDQLNLPGLGLRVISSDERELAYQKLHVPLTTLPSRATTIKLAREAKATMVVIGTYSVTPGQGETLASLQGRASVIRVNEGRL
ncbi:MAG: hypothetical protein JOZ52_08690, partial [Acidobacteria bacterium]|nr:hypothetical protein [Acidobacteriota bacterium]